MAERVLDTLIVKYLFQADTAALNRLERRIDAARNKINAIGNAMGVVGTALTGALTGVASTIYGFEEQMNALRAVINGTDEDMAALRDQAKELGSTTSFSASEAAKAQTELAKAGLDVTEVLEAMPGVLQLAEAGNLSLDQAASIVTSTLKSFNKPASEAGEITDVLAAAASSANTTVAQLGVAMRDSAPLANELGVPMQELVAFIATLQDKGIPAAQAGTSIRNLMQRLVKPTAEAADAMSNMGINYDEVADLINQGRLNDALALFGEAGMTAKEAVEVFGAETANAALIASKEAAKIDEFTKALENSAGTAERMAEQMNAGMVGAWRNLRSAFEGLQIEIGDAGLTGKLETLIDRTTEMVQWFSNLDQQTLELIGDILLFGPPLVAAAGALKGLAIVMGWFMPLITFVGSLITGLGALFAALLSPIGILAAAFAGAVYLIYDNWSGVVAFFEDVWKGIKNAFPDTAEYFENLFPVVEGMFDWITEQWTSTLTWFKGPGADQTVYDWLRTPVDGLFAWLTNLWNDALALMTADSLSVDWYGVGDAIGEFIGRAVVLAVGGLAGIIDELMNRVTQLDFAAVGKLIGRVILGAMKVAITTLDGIVGGLLRGASELDLSAVGGAIGRAIRVAIVAIFTTGASLLSELWDILSSQSSDIDWGEIGKQIGSALLNAIIAVITGAGDLIAETIKELLGETLIGRIGNWGSDLFSVEPTAIDMQRQQANASEPVLQEFLGTALEQAPTYEYVSTPGPGNAGYAVKNTTINVGEVVVNTEATDGEGIAQDLSNTLGDQLQDAAEDFNTGTF